MIITSDLNVAKKKERQCCYNSCAPCCQVLRSVVSSWWWWAAAESCQHQVSFTGSVWLLMVVVSSSSLWDPLEIIFICLLMWLCSSLFIPWSSVVSCLYWLAPQYIQISERDCVLKTLSCLLPLKPILFRSVFLLASVSQVVGCPVPSL